MNGDPNETNMAHTLSGLCDRGVLFRTRHGYYAFTVPMSETMILRRLRRQDELAYSWDSPPNLGRTQPGSSPHAPPKQRASETATRKKRWFG
jgi:hypothetical protein